jgi:hypothetical protein
LAKYKQINSEGCKLMGEGGAHESDPYPGRACPAVLASTPPVSPRPG